MQGLPENVFGFVDVQLPKGFVRQKYFDRGSVSRSFLISFFNPGNEIERDKMVVVSLIHCSINMHATVPIQGGDIY